MPPVKLNVPAVRNTTCPLGHAAMAALYANTVPSSLSLPPSFYLAAKPAWWGTGAFSRDRSRRDRRYRLWRTFFRNSRPALLLKHTGGYGRRQRRSLSFNAIKCCGSASPPAPPPQISATVH